MLAVVVAVSSIQCRPPAPGYLAVRGSEIRAHLAELRRDGEAELGTVVVVPGQPMQAGDVEHVFLYQTVRVGRLTTSIEAVAAGCPPAIEHVAPAGCALERYRDTPIKLRDLRRDPPRPTTYVYTPLIVSAAFTLASLGGLTYCIANCESHRGLKSLGLGFGAAMFGVVSYVLAGGTIRD